MNKVNIEKSMRDCLLEAFKNNAIITSDGLSDGEFIHVCNHRAYYEDGGYLGTFSETLDLLKSQEWTHTHKWFIIGYLTSDEVNAIRDIINDPNIYDSSRYQKELNKVLGVE